MEVFTTGQVAKICKVAPRTVSKWFDSGRLGGYRIPDSQDRRVPRDKLIKFLKEHGMPLGNLEDDLLTRVLVFSKDPALIASIHSHMNHESAFKVEVAENIFSVGSMMDSLLPECVVVDFEVGMSDAESVCRSFTKSSDFSQIVVIAVLSANTPNTMAPFVKASFTRPFDVRQLAEEIRKFIGLKGI